MMNRYLIWTLSFLFLLAGLLALIVTLTIRGETRSFLDERQREFRQRISWGRKSLALLEEQAAQEVVEMARSIVEERGGAERRRGFGFQGFGEELRASLGAGIRSPLILDVFVLEADRVLYPRRPASLKPGEGVDYDLAAENRLQQAHQLRNQGDLEACVRVLERLSLNSNSAVLRAEADLLLATTSLELGRDPDDAIRVLREVATPSREDRNPTLFLLRFSASLRLARIYEDLSMSERSGSVLVSLLGVLTQPEVYFSLGSDLVYFREEALRRIELGITKGAISPETEGRLRDLQLRLSELDGEADYRRRFDREIRTQLEISPARDQAGAEPGRRHRLLLPGGDLLVYFEREFSIVGKEVGVVGGDGGSGDLDPQSFTLGFVTSRNAYFRELFRLTGGPGSQVDRVVLNVRDEDEALLWEFAGSSPPGGPSVQMNLDELGIEKKRLFVELFLGDELARFRVARGWLYGTVLFVVWLAISSGALITLRGVKRQLELAQLREHFVANVSHELKTPLTLIRMYTDLLRDGYSRTKEDSDESLAVIQRECRFLSDLVDDVLDFSQIDAGEKQYSLEVWNPEQVVAETFQEVLPFLEKKELTGVFSPPQTELPEVAFDRESFVRAVRNLLSNAVKYAREGKVIEVRLGEDRGGISLEVLDRGPGFRIEDRDKLFERFYREKGRSQSAGGAGVGLALLHHFVKAHGGEVIASPRDGGGSRFGFWLPGTSQTSRGC